LISGRRNILLYETWRLAPGLAKYRRLFPRGLSGLGVKVTTCLRLAPKLRKNTRSCTSAGTCAHRDGYTFNFIKNCPRRNILLNSILDFCRYVELWQCRTPFVLVRTISSAHEEGSRPAFHDSNYITFLVYVLFPASTSD